MGEFFITQALYRIQFNPLHSPTPPWHGRDHGRAAFAAWELAGAFHPYRSPLPPPSPPPPPLEARREARREGGAASQARWCDQPRWGGATSQAGREAGWEAGREARGSLRFGGGEHERKLQLLILQVRVLQPPRIPTHPTHPTRPTWHQPVRNQPTERVVVSWHCKPPLPYP